MVNVPEQRNGLMRTRRRLSALLAAALLALAAAPVQIGHAQSGPTAIAAKSCSAGYVHAVVPGGAHKCLRAGQYCSHRAGYARVYRNAGYRCAANGRLRHL
jgi:hypothetical protein